MDPSFLSKLLKAKEESDNAFDNMKKKLQSQSV